MDSGRKSEAQRFLRELQEKAFFKERKRIEERNAEKTVRLKALRLAKEAQEAQTAAAEAATKVPKSKKVRQARAAKAGGADMDSLAAAVLPSAQDTNDGAVSAAVAARGDLK